MLTAEIIGVGDELLYGETLDTNTAEIARSLQPYALSLTRTLRFADHLPALTAQIAESWQQADLLVLSGGLGPTPDDITREAIAAALGESMEIDPPKLQWLEGIFAARNFPMPQANQKQAMKVASAVWLENPRGTAPGWWIHKNQKHLICLPGPPSEWRAMWAEVLPKLNLPQRPYAQTALKTFGLGESRIVELLGELFQRSGAVEVGTYAKMDGVQVVVRGEPAAVTQRVSQIRPLIAEHIWGENEQTLPEKTLAVLEAQGATLSTLEAMSGGFLAQLLCIAHSKAYAGGRVDAAQSAVSAAVAEGLAAQAQSQFQTRFALATVGVLGPQAVDGQPVGTLYVGLATPQGLYSKHLRLSGAGQAMLRQRAAHAALAFLLAELKGGGQ